MRFQGVCLAGPDDAHGVGVCLQHAGLLLCADVACGHVDPAHGDRGAIEQPSEVVGAGGRSHEPPPCLDAADEGLGTGSLELVLGRKGLGKTGLEQGEDRVEVLWGCHALCVRRHSMGICRGCRSRCRSIGVHRGCLILAALVLHSQLSTKRLGKVVRACHAQAAPVAVELEGLRQGDVHIRVACQVAYLCTKVGRRLVGACLLGFQQAHPS